MKLILFFALITFIVFVALTYAQLGGSVSITLSSSKVWWNGSATASGVAKFSNGDPIGNSDLNITLNSIRYCTNTTDVSGNYACTFTAPNVIGDYALVVNVTTLSSTYTNTTTLSVSPTYGKTPVASTEKVVYEVPMLILDQDGSIKTIWIKVTVWKG